MKEQVWKVDRAAVIFVSIMVVLVLGYGIALGYAQSGALAGAPPGSTFNAGNSGAQVLLAYLKGMDVEVETLRQFEELPDAGTIVLIADEPLRVGATRAEGRRLRSWVEDGGDVVLIGPYARDVFYGTPVGIDTGPSGSEGRMRPIQASVYVQDVEEVFVGKERLLASDPAWVPTLKDESGSALASRSMGRGGIAWLASAYPATNKGIAEYDNARLVTLLAAVRQPVYFDEYHHGYGKNAGVWQRLGPGGRSAAVLGMLALVIALVASARRLGPPIPVPEERPVRTGAYIGQLASLYREAGARPEALDSLSEGLRSALGKRYGTVQAGLGRHAEAKEALEKARAQVEQGGIGEERFVETARALIRARRDVEGRDG